MKRLTKAVYNEMIDALYAAFHRISIQSSELIYDLRFNENTSLICKNFISEISVSCTSAIALIELFRNQSKKMKENMLMICNNNAIYAEHIMDIAEKYVDNLIACAENPTVFDMIDKYVDFMNHAKTTIDNVMNDFLTEDTIAAVQLIRMQREQINDADDDGEALFS